MNLHVDLPDGWYKLYGDGLLGSPDQRDSVYYPSERWIYWIRVQSKTIVYLIGLDVFNPMPQITWAGFANDDLPTSSQEKFLKAVEKWGASLQSLIICDGLNQDDWMDDFKIKL